MFTKTGAGPECVERTLLSAAFDLAASACPSLGNFRPLTSVTSPPRTDCNYSLAWGFVRS